METAEVLPMYTVDEVAALLQTTPFVINKYARNKKLRAVKVGRDWRFRRNDIKRYVEGD